jgi:hypothetical protein
VHELSVDQPPFEPALATVLVVSALAVCSLCDGHARAIPAVRRTTKPARAAVIGLAP